MRRFYFGRHSNKNGNTDSSWRENLFIINFILHTINMNVYTSCNISCIHVHFLDMSRAHKAIFANGIELINASEISGTYFAPENINMSYRVFV